MNTPQTLGSLDPTSSLVAIVGPTGIGKTALAVRLATRLPIEIVSADSRQVYRGMDIGTAKPTPGEQRAVRHHLIDIVDPDEPFSLSDYLGRAAAAIAGIQSRGKLPLLVGGTGLYVKAVTEGYSIPAVPPDPTLRAVLAHDLEGKGLEWLVAEVMRVDPDTATRERANPRRLIRALEVYHATGRPMSEQQRGVPPPYDVVRIGLTMPRTELYARVDSRLDAMLAAGLVDEVSRLHEMGYAWDLPSMSGLGYRQIGRFVRGECGLPEAVADAKFATHAFIRHQYSWFRLADPAIRWLDVSTGVSAADAL